jgi:hypothetical protein
MRARRQIPTVLAVGALLLTGCSTDSDRSSAPTADSPSSRHSRPSAVAEPTQPGPSWSDRDRRPVQPVSVLGLAEQRHRGDQLRLGAVREQTSAYTSYDVTYRSRTTTRRGEEVYTISGVLDLPRGRGPFPAVVLAHGYIDPASYVRGQGMTRERGYLAARGYVALHVDYRNHAESDDDPRYQARMRMGYSSDDPTFRSTTTGWPCSGGPWAAVSC